MDSHAGLYCLNIFFSAMLGILEQRQQKTISPFNLFLNFISILYLFIFCLKFLFARDDEFSPLKNGAGAAKDTAETSKNALFKQHRYPLIIMWTILLKTSKIIHQQH